MRIRFSIGSLILFSFLFVFTTSVKAQSTFTGKWSGVLEIQTMKLGLVFDINKDGTEYTATMDSPDQGAKGIPVKQVTVNGDSITISIPSILMVYKGKKVDENNIEGTFSQRGSQFDLNLKRGELVEKKRPQDPEKPYPYQEDSVSFINPSTGNRLSGTLTLPKEKGKFAAIVLVTGSGPQDRDETLMGHKPFLVLSDYLTRNGYAVLRYDDRGVGLSEGKFSTATTSDFASDALAAVHYLEGRKEINKKKIGVMGHSEGGVIAAELAANNKEIAFIVMLAGTGMRGDQILLQQQKAIAKGAGVADSTIKKSQEINKNVFDIICSTKDTALIRKRTELYLNTVYDDGTLEGTENMSKAAAVDAFMKELLTPWLIHFIQYDPANDLRKIRVPTLALIGSKDHQVIPEYNIPALKENLAANKKAEVLELPGLNHLFQEAKTGLPAEYAQIEQTFSPLALTTILDWLKKNVK